MPGVEIIRISVVLSHVCESVGACMFEKGFRCSVSRVIVVEVQSHLFVGKCPVVPL